MTPLLHLAIPTLIILAVVTVSYGWACWVDPFVTCKTCSGFGAVADPRTGRTRPCRACKRHGIRLRAGRHVLNAYLRNRDTSRIPHRPTEATKPTEPTTGRRTNNSRLDWW